MGDQSFLVRLAIFSVPARVAYGQAKFEEHPV